MDPRPCARAARARRPRSVVREALPGVALGRAAPTRRPRAGTRGRPATAAHGRAVRRDPPERPCASAGRVAASAGRSPEDRRLRHARRRRGDQARRPDRDPPPGRRSGPVRHAAGDPRATGRRLRGGVHRRRPRAQGARAAHARRAAPAGSHRQRRAAPAEHNDAAGCAQPPRRPARDLAPRHGRERQCARHAHQGRLARMIVAAGPVIPNFGSGSKCEQNNGWWCTDWLRAHWSDTLQPALVQHIELALIAVGIGFVIAFALALAGYRYRMFDPPIGIFADFLYTIPSLALFQLLVPITGLTVTTVEVALVSYTLLILYRNMIAGLRNVPEEALEAAQGMGMTPRQTFLRVEL